jgi:hypothetical protein
MWWRELVRAKSKISRFFAYHPRTYPKELTLFRAPGTFGGPFAQNDSGMGREARLLRMTAV